MYLQTCFAFQQSGQILSVSFDYSFRYVLNTCVDPPHDDKVTGLLFQPSTGRHSRSSRQRHSHHGNSQLVHMAITTSLDGRFRSWILVDGKEQDGEKESAVPPSWACRSVGYYHKLPCLGGAFSEDGSLLALNFKKVCQGSTTKC